MKVGNIIEIVKDKSYGITKRGSRGTIVDIDGINVRATFFYCTGERFRDLPEDDPRTWWIDGGDFIVLSKLHKVLE